MVVSVNSFEMDSHVLNSLMLPSHKSPMDRSPALAKILARSIEKLKLEPIKLVDHQMLVARTSDALVGGINSICLTIYATNILGLRLYLDIEYIV